MVNTHPITRLQVDGFMSIREMDLELGKLNVMIGPNGSGKSNLIAYFEMLRQMMDGRLGLWTGLRGGADRVLSFGGKQTQELSSRVEFGDNAYAFTLRQTDTDSFAFADERPIYTPADPHGYALGSGHKEALLQTQLRTDDGYLRRADYIDASIKSWRVYHVHDTSNTARMKMHSAVHDSDYLRFDASNLAAFLYKLKQQHNDVYTRICKTVQLAIPFFDDFVLEPKAIRHGEEVLMLQWRRNDSDYKFLPAQLSDGSLRFICLVTALLQPEPPTTIIIDEPELGLHPFAITLMGALLDSASEIMQVIVATQSSRLIDSFCIDDLIVVELVNGETTFDRLAETSFDLWLENYSVGELWEKNVISAGLP